MSSHVHACPAMSSHVLVCSRASSLSRDPRTADTSLSRRQLAWIAGVLCYAVRWQPAAWGTACM
eukprot:1976564-Rhodomonas_salina.1